MRFTFIDFVVEFNKNEKRYIIGIVYKNILTKGCFAIPVCRFSQSMSVYTDVNSINNDLIFNKKFRSRLLHRGRRLLKKIGFMLTKNDKYYFVDGTDLKTLKFWF